MPAADVSLGYAMSLPPAEAIRYFESKGYVMGFNWHDVEARAHATAFTVAGILRQDVLENVRTGFRESLQRGETLQQFERRLLPYLTEQGWLGRGLVADEDGVLQGKQLTPRRLRTIFTTNMQSAYGAGRYEAQMATRESHPYWQRIAVMDTHTRPAHAALNLFTARYDDPVWQFMYPPDGYGCRCRVRTLTPGQVESSGIVVQSWADRVETVQQAWGPDETREVKALRFNGKLYTPDAGFGHNPGRDSLAALGQRLMDRSAQAAPRLASLAVEAVMQEPAVLAAVTNELGRWVNGVLVDNAPGRDLRRVGALHPDTLTALEKAGQPPASAVQTITGDAVRAEPGPLWQQLPALLRKPVTTLQDGRDIIWVVDADGGRIAVRGVPGPDGITLAPESGGRPLTRTQRDALAQLPELGGGSGV